MKKPFPFQYNSAFIWTVWVHVVQPFLHNDSLCCLASRCAESWDVTLPASLYANNNLLIFQRRRRLQISLQHREPDHLAEGSSQQPLNPSAWVRKSPFSSCSLWMAVGNCIQLPLVVRKPEKAQIPVPSNLIAIRHFYVFLSERTRSVHLSMEHHWRSKAWPSRKVELWRRLWKYPRSYHRVVTVGFPDMLCQSLHTIPSTSVWGGS